MRTHPASGLAGLGALSVLLARLGGASHAVISYRNRKRGRAGWLRGSDHQRLCSDWWRSVDLAQEQATLAQCKGEGARGGDPGDYGHKERSITIACMARNGYIIQTQ